MHELNSSFITSVLAGIEKSNRRTGYDIIIAHSSESLKKEIGKRAKSVSQKSRWLDRFFIEWNKNLDHFSTLRQKNYLLYFDRVDESKAILQK